MMKSVLTGAALALAVVSQAATVFAAGDLAIVGYNSGNPDDVAILSLVNFDAGTSFYITDYGWRGAQDGFRGGGEGWIKATATRAYSAGEVFVIRRGGVSPLPIVDNYQNAAFTFEWDGTPTTPEFAPSAAGDQIFLFQGDFTDSTSTSVAATIANGGLIFGLNGESTGADAEGWQTDATSSNNSALPNTLTVGSTALGLFPGGATEFDNAVYNRALTTGTKAELLAAIANRSNWTFTDGDVTGYQFNVDNYNVVPEPASMTVLGLGIAAILRKRLSR